MTLGIVKNPYATNVPTQIVEAATELNIPVRVMDLPSLTVEVELDGKTVVSDSGGVIEVSILAPYLLFGYPTAVHALRILERQAHTQNPINSVLVADDKAATAVQLSAASVPQVPSKLCALVLDRARTVAEEIGYPVVLKRTHGAQGRWVRRVENPDLLGSVFRELESEGPGTLIIQPEVAEFHGRSIRAVVTGGQLLAATLRTAAGNEWRSNIAGGANQHRIDLSWDEKKLAVDAVRALGLGHAGVDILRTARGPLVLEVNSCPDFTSMLSYFTENLTRAVLTACLPITRP